jgi:5-methylcytosine-specific restriction enzyme subunit McrC
LTRRTVRLIERRPRTAKLPRAEAEFLLAHARHVVEVVPTFDRGTYRLTPRGFVGFLDGPAARYLVAPKIPWPNLCLLLGLSGEPAGNPLEPGGDLLAVLATAFAERLESVTGAGLVAGYGEADAVSPFLRGRLRTADQMRDAAARAFPDRFHVVESVFDLNTPWNRVPTATAAALLRRALPLSLRRRVEAAALPLAGLPDAAPTDAEFAAARTEPRAAGYRPLLDVCRLILDGLRCADPDGTGAGGFLVDLSRAFERYLATALRDALAARPGWRVEEQPAFALGPTELQPDVLVRRDGAPWAVLDAKWKKPEPAPADLHQVLAYAALTGAPRVALVYPGRSDGRTRFATPDGRVGVTLFRLRVAGGAAELALSVERLARSVRKG